MKVMKSGIVKKYVADRGFGFIKTKDSGDVFFHINNGRHPVAVLAEVVNSERKAIGDPKEGDQIMFEVVKGQKGLMASPWCFAEAWECAEKELGTPPATEKEIIIGDPTPPHGDKTMRKEPGRKNPYERQRNRIKDNTDGEKDWKKDL